MNVSLLKAIIVSCMLTLSSCFFSGPKQYDIEDVSIMRFINSVPHSQGGIGSCTGSAVASAAESQLTRFNKNVGKLSSLFLHWNSRNITDFNDYIAAGAAIAITLDALDRYGVPPESYWQSDIDMQNTKPTFAAYRAAFGVSGIWQYREITSTDDERVFEFAKELESNNAVVISLKMWKTMHDLKSDEILEERDDVLESKRHSMTIVGWSKIKQAFILRNSWGPDWGANGHCYVSTSFVKSSMVTHAWMLKIR